MIIETYDNNTNKLSCINSWGNSNKYITIDANESWLKFYSVKIEKMVWCGY